MPTAWETPRACPTPLQIIGSRFSTRACVHSRKLYFYDVGLAAFLLGIENAKQLLIDPLRGSLFQNLMIAEVLKYRFNQGNRINLGKLFPDSIPTDSGLVYGSEAEQQRSNVSIVPVQCLHRLFK